MSAGSDLSFQKLVNTHQKFATSMYRRVQTTFGTTINTEFDLLQSIMNSFLDDIDTTCSSFKVQITKFNDEEEELKFKVKEDCNLIQYLFKHKLNAYAVRQGWKLQLKPVTDQSIVAEIAVNEDCCVLKCKEEINQWICEFLPSLCKRQYDMSLKTALERLSSTLLDLMATIKDNNYQADIFLDKDTNNMVIAGYKEGVDEIYQKAKAKLYLVDMEQNLESALHGFLLRKLGFLDRFQIGEQPCVHGCLTKVTWTGTEEDVSRVKTEMDVFLKEIKSETFDISHLVERLLSGPEVRLYIDKLLKTDDGPPLCVWQLNENGKVHVWCLKASVLKRSVHRIKQSIGEDVFSVQNFPFILKIAQEGFHLTDREMSYFVMEQTSDECHVAAISPVMTKIIDKLQFFEEQNQLSEEQIHAENQQYDNGTSMKFSPPLDKEELIQNDAALLVNTRHSCITAMEEDRGKNLDELSMEHYICGSKGNQSTSPKDLDCDEPQTREFEIATSNGGTCVNWVNGESLGYQCTSNGHVSTPATNTYGSTPPGFEEKPKCSTLTDISSTESISMESSKSPKYYQNEGKEDVHSDNDFDSAKGVSDNVGSQSDTLSVEEEESYDMSSVEDGGPADERESLSSNDTGRSVCINDLNATQEQMHRTQKLSSSDDLYESQKHCQVCRGSTEGMSEVISGDSNQLYPDVSLPETITKAIGVEQDTESVNLTLSRGDKDFTITKDAAGNARDMRNVYQAHQARKLSLPDNFILDGPRKNSNGVGQYTDSIPQDRSHGKCSGYVTPESSQDVECSKFTKNAADKHKLAVSSGTSSIPNHEDGGSPDVQGKEGELRTDSIPGDTPEDDTEGDDDKGSPYPKSVKADDYDPITNDTADNARDVVSSTFDRPNLVDGETSQVKERDGFPSIDTREDFNEKELKVTPEKIARAQSHEHCQDDGEPINTILEDPSGKDGTEGNDEQFSTEPEVSLLGNVTKEKGKEQDSGSTYPKTVKADDYDQITKDSGDNARDVESMTFDRPNLVDGGRSQAKEREGFSTIYTREVFNTKELKVTPKKIARAQSHEHCQDGFGRNEPSDALQKDDILAVGKEQDTENPTENMIPTGSPIGSLSPKLSESDENYKSEEKENDPDNNEVIVNLLESVTIGSGRGAGGQFSSLSAQKTGPQGSLTVTAIDADNTTEVFGTGNPFTFGSNVEFSNSILASKLGKQHILRKDSSKSFIWPRSGEQLFASDNRKSVRLPDLDNNETALFDMRARVYRFENKEWTKRGTGQMRILKKHETGKIRLVLRDDQDMSLACNHWLTPDMVFKPLAAAGTSWCWIAHDFSDKESKVEKFAVRFKNVEIAKEFKEIIDKCLHELQERTIQNTQTKSTINDMDESNTGSETEEDIGIISEGSISEYEGNYQTTPEGSVSGIEEYSGIIHEGNIPGTEGDSGTIHEENISQKEENYPILQEEVYIPQTEEAEETILHEVRGMLYAGERALGIGWLKVIYDENISVHRVVMETDDRLTVCNHIVTHDYPLTIDHSKGTCKWSPVDFSLGYPVLIEFRAEFNSTSVLDQFQRCFLEGQCLAIDSGISGQNTVVTYPRETAYSPYIKFY